MKLDSWETLIQEEMDFKTKESLDDIVFVWPSRECLREEFDAGYGVSNGTPFTAWSKSWVYFPVTYDGSESVGSVPRFPCEIATEHLGGE